MLNYVRLAIATVLIVGATVVANAVPASSDGHEVCVYDPETQTWTCEDDDDGGGDGGGGDGGGGSGGVASCYYEGEQIPCTSGWGYWSNPRACYIKEVDPQPPLSDPIWQGRTDGKIYVCTPPDASCPPIDPSCIPGEWIWSETPPPQTPPINPEDLAREVLASMQLKAMDINMAPPTLSQEPDSMVPVGLPVWMWTNETPRSWGRIERSASDRGLTVYVEAGVTKAVWEMGDGESIVCRRPGTPYKASYGVGRESPDCGHIYTEKNDSYDITASSYWLAEWYGGDQTGELLFRIDSEDELRVGEIQAIRIE